MMKSQFFFNRENSDINFVNTYPNNGARRVRIFVVCRSRVENASVQKWRIVTTRVSDGGAEHYNKLGEKRRRRVYTLVEQNAFVISHNKAGQQNRLA